MKNYLRWKKPFFSDSYSIYSANQIVGILKDKTFSHSATGKLKGKEYTFKTIGIFKQTTKIIDNSENKVIGTIDYSNWMTKATLSISGKSIFWKYDNCWNTRWSIHNNKDIEIKYAGSSSGGTIECNYDDPLLILCGLFVTNYYWQVSMAVMVAIFVPILTATLN